MKRFIRIGVVTAWPDDDWHSQRLLSALGRRGEAIAIDPAALAAVVEGEDVAVTAAGRALGEVDAFVLARGLGRAGDPDVQFEIYRALEGAGAIVVNRIEPLLAAQDKFRTSWLLARAGVPTPPAAVVQSAEAADRALATLGDAVMKPVAGSLGDDVARVGRDAEGRRAIAERAARDGALYLQQYVPHPGRDLRVFVVGGETRAAITRHAPPGEWRTNVAGGGRAESTDCPDAVRQVAEAAAAVLGLDYAGVDLVIGDDGPTVIEVNGNPSWRGILEATGLDMADAIAEHVLGRALRGRMTSDHIVREPTGATHG
ncbi:RimK family alpha-L-glutamate ligase [Anaeromyxobacter oryzae]|uniref:Tetrahydromethanopterin:alpha-L-glutamate ligase n=1 Tax=Anaeromyxobacter oryzae TaxID=2918170 RepID=A0ABM7X424_9BACT|nr:RimK family alpha-L-glutamate ligase [Anaeromyxobacter oryzae]BDG06563.1 tetrahydromethanopterin:alpha-L-glutamate ligase [Anaeromyxobacter oryzae]